MKNLKFIAVIITAVVVAFTSSCKKGFDEYNESSTIEQIEAKFPLVYIPMNLRI